MECVLLELWGEVKMEDVIGGNIRKVQQSFKAMPKCHNKPQGITSALNVLV